VPSRNNTPGGGRLIRKWAITAVTPFEKSVVGTSRFFRHGWSNYIGLYDVRKRNEELEAELARMKLEQARLQTAADQNRRLRALLDFKEHYIGQTLAAQVIQSSGTEQSRVVIIDKGSRAGIAADMAVITPGGIVGKVREVYPLSSQVLLVNDRESGAGVILQNSRLQGILRGTSFGELRVSDIMSDEKVEVGEQIVTSGGDRIYPKGVPVGTVTSVSPDHDNDPFLAIKVKPAADLARLEEVLVVTTRMEELPKLGVATNQVRAADILAQRLPSVTKTDAAAKDAASKTGSAKPAASPSPGAAVPLSAKPSATPVSAYPSATPVAGAGKPVTTNSNAPDVVANSPSKPASTNPASSTPGSPTPAAPKAAATKTVAPKPTGTATNPDGSPAASTSPTPKPKPPVKKAPPKASPTATPAATDQPASRTPDTQAPASETEKPPR
jgi:rod shape-determining protein MreC